MYRKFDRFSDNNKIWGEKGYQNTAHFGQNTSFFRKN